MAVDDLDVAAVTDVDPVVVGEGVADGVHLVEHDVFAAPELVDPAGRVIYVDSGDRDVLAVVELEDGGTVGFVRTVLVVPFGREDTYMEEGIDLEGKGPALSVDGSLSVDSDVVGFVGDKQGEVSPLSIIIIIIGTSEDNAILLKMELHVAFKLDSAGKEFAGRNDNGPSVLGRRIDGCLDGLRVHCYTVRLGSILRDVMVFCSCGQCQREHDNDCRKC